VAENVLKMKKRAVELGMSKADAKKASRKELEAFLRDAENGGGSKSAGKSVVKKAVAKKKGTAAKKSARKQTERKQTARKASGTSRPKAAKASSNGNGDLGRAGIAVSELDWNAESDDWNPRAGGPVERLFKALKKARGNVDKAFDALSGDVWDFVGRKKRDGSKRSKPEAENMLRYRLNRTLWEFATRTGQHERAENRVEYGHGSYATVRKASKRGRPKASASTKSAGTKKASASKKTAGKKTRKRS